MTNQLVYVLLEQVGSTTKPFIFGFAGKPCETVVRQLDAFQCFIKGIAGIHKHTQEIS